MTPEHLRLTLVNHLSNGVRVFAPSWLNLNKEDFEELVTHTTFLMRVTHQQVYAVYFNPDFDNQGDFHGIKYLFEERDL